MFADATAEHISITIDAGHIGIKDNDAKPGTPATVSIEITPILTAPTIFSLLIRRRRFPDDSLLHSNRQQCNSPEWATTRRDCTSGPGGLGGVIYSDGSGRTGYYPDVQDWSESGLFWIGVDRDPVTPESLERAEMIGGHYVRLEDGHDWLIPVARCFPIGSRLPSIPHSRPRRGVGGGGPTQICRGLPEADPGMEGVDRR